MIRNSELEILLNDSGDLTFAPESLEQELAQNIRMILTTSKYSVPMDREFGMNATLLDMPQNVAEALLMNEIAESIEKYEPRVKVSEIKFTGNNDGLLKPLIRVQVI